MSPDPFVHLHVASGYSLQYGASHPQTLVERAVEQEMDTLALTDRDGTYGAVKFTRACARAGIRPVLGVDPAVAPVGVQPLRGAAARTPVRGGAHRDLPAHRGGLPRVTFPASGKAGWAAICRMVSATHLTGERGRPVATLESLAPYLMGGDVMVLLGPASELGVAAARRRHDLALAALAPWRDIVPRDNLVVELVSHRLPDSSAHAARMAQIARRAELTTVLTNAVRYADRLDAPTVDVLDAARRLVALDRRHVDRGNAEGFLKSGKQMHEMAEEICRLSGLANNTEMAARQLLAQTRAVADRCALDPRADLGIGEVHFPEFQLGGGDGGAGRTADGMLRARCDAAVGDRHGSAPRQRIWKRLDDELELIRGLGYASYFLTVADITDLIGEMGIRRAARGSGAGSPVNYLLGVSGVDPIRHGLLMERFLSPLRASLPDIDVDVESARRLEVYEAIPGQVRRGALCLRVDDGHLPRAPRGP
ncbi:PHP domain-containing protein [Nocardioides sp. B-3]|uniref:PHP domain-containing protein n=1 Tax=Nocardioides sp. B-3 TaxID=2895565 RepID=UPI00215314B2|nr:PHP domain-containing protein [Nocardioides sp. B-3]